MATIRISVIKPLIFLLNTFIVNGEKVDSNWYVRYQTCADPIPAALFSELLIGHCCRRCIEKKTQSSSVGERELQCFNRPSPTHRLDCVLSIVISTTYGSTA